MSSVGIRLLSIGKQIKGFYCCSFWILCKLVVEHEVNWKGGRNIGTTNLLKPTMCVVFRAVNLVCGTPRMYVSIAM